MSDTWGLWVCIVVYTITIGWFGMFVQRKSDQFQLQKFEEAAFKDGCLKCAEFERLQCDRDNTLSGVEESHKINENNHSGVKKSTGDDASVDGSDSTIRDSNH